jgi:hypothetical protein
VLKKTYIVWGFSEYSGIEECYRFDDPGVAEEVRGILARLGLEKSRVSMRLEDSHGENQSTIQG